MNDEKPKNTQVPYISNSLKVSKEQLEQKVNDMKKRAEELEKQREENYKSFGTVDETRDEDGLKKGLKPKFVNDISKKAFVEHSMDLSESINRKSHYNQRMKE